MTHVGHARQTSLTYQIARREFALCVYNKSCIMLRSLLLFAAFMQANFNFINFQLLILHSSKHLTEESVRHFTF